MNTREGAPAALQGRELQEAAFGRLKTGGTCLAVGCWLQNSIGTAGVLVEDRQAGGPRHFGVTACCRRLTFYRLIVRPLNCSSVRKISKSINSFGASLPMSIAQ